MSATLCFLPKICCSERQSGIFDAVDDLREQLHAPSSEHRLRTISSDLPDDRPARLEAPRRRRHGEGETLSIDG